MTDKSFDWSFLFETHNQALRADITNEDHEREAMAFIQSAYNLIDRELMRIATDAQSQADVFWEQNRVMRKTGGGKEQGQYGTRIKLNKSCLSIQWYRNQYHIGKSDQIKPPFSHYIPKGRAGYRYPKSTFTDIHNSWEKDLIEQIEQRYGSLRAQAETLSEMRNLLRKYKTLIFKSYGAAIEK